jgi:hypothetical protein
MFEHHDAAAAWALLRIAAATNGDVESVLLHSDRESEYAAEEMGMRAFAFARSVGPGEEQAFDRRPLP